jgi:signal transduction histidine kinase
MPDKSLSSVFLQLQGYTLLEYAGAGAFLPATPLADWWRDIFVGQMKEDGSFTLDGKALFLENFLVDAEEFWDSSKEGSVESGSWIEKTEDGRELAFEATALNLLGKRILVIQNPQKRYDEQHQVLQKARDTLLLHERLQKEIQKKEILLHCIIHDLSQPLTAMRTCFSLIAMQKLNPTMKEMVEIAHRQSEKQEAMIRSILEAFSADLAAQQAAVKEPGKAPDFARCAQKTVEAFKSAFIEKKASIELDPALDLSRDWRVLGEESRILRIFGNLVENAMRHSPAESVVTVGVQEEEDRYLRGFVDDQGPGLPEDETATRLFALFAKGKDERAGKAGLGLYFCKITVEGWGGTIGCETRPGGGARFWFQLPRV